MATSLFEYNFGLSDLCDKSVMVWAVSLITLAALRLNKPSSFEPLARSRTSTVESRSSWKTDGWYSGLGSISKTTINFATTFDFTVLGSLPNYFSNGDVLSSFFLIRSANKISDNLDLSFVTTTCLFARNRSYIV